MPLTLPPTRKVLALFDCFSGDKVDETNVLSRTFGAMQTLQPIHGAAGSLSCLCFSPSTSSLLALF
jgi:hypothetical protein